MFCIFVQVQKDHNKLQIIFLVKENKNILQKVSVDRRSELFVARTVWRSQQCFRTWKNWCPVDLSVRRRIKVVARKLVHRGLQQLNCRRKWGRVITLLNFFRNASSSWGTHRTAGWTSTSSSRHITITSADSAGGKHIRNLRRRHGVGVQKKKINCKII